ncbi:MAG: DUF3552 domain-containing protein, partial [Candidatus Komeilibacteria bacterium]|nr:DUF3552 domain-containing protein [Candidatus Komeilibacteria bacterium]MBT4447183.1 DUF3552 domain-containing protein [Candidatus Komeilibacteria bacterium]
MNLFQLIAALIIGAILGFIIKKLFTSQRVNSAERKAEAILAKANQKSSDILLESKDKSLKLIEEAKVEEKERRKSLHDLENRLTKRESLFDKKLMDLEGDKQSVINSKKQLEKNKTEIKEIRKQQLDKLEKVAALSQEDAKEVLMNNVEARSKDELLHRMRKLEEQGSEEMEAKAKAMLTTVIERCAAAHTVETTTTSVSLPNEEMKGRIIGREGRNIKAIEHLTGVEIIIDDTPDAILVS